MKYSCETRHHVDFSGTADDYELEYTYEKYECKECKIKFDEDWAIPKKYERPTAKQLKTVNFINNVCGFRFEPLLKIQCWRFIKENLQKAITISTTQQEYEDNYNDTCFY